MTKPTVPKTFLLIFSLVFFALTFCLSARVQATMGNTFDKAAYYAALAGKEVAAIDLLLNQIHLLDKGEQAAYEGALLMKKAGLLSKAKEKLQVFKQGRSKLEQAIATGNGNPEFHFLRLVIQENAPKIVKYKSNLDKDALIVRNSFKKLPQVVQHAVLNYSKKSTILNAADF